MMKCSNCDCTEVTFFQGVAYCELCRRMDCWVTGANTKPVSDKYLLIDCDSHEHLTGPLKRVIEEYGDDFGGHYEHAGIVKIFDSNFNKVELKKTWEVM